jgi:hypothetical protein
MADHLGNPRLSDGQRISLHGRKIADLPIWKDGRINFS